MRTISPKRVQEACKQFRDSELTRDLESWMQGVKAAQWKSFNELQQTDTSADWVDGLVVFNLRHNRYRMITRVLFSNWSERYGEWTKGQILIGAVMTHSEYDRWTQLDAQKKKERIWPQR